MPIRAASVSWHLKTSPARHNRIGVRGDSDSEQNATGYAPFGTRRVRSCYVIRRARYGRVAESARWRSTGDHVDVMRDFTHGDQIAVRELVLGGMRERWGDAYDPSANPDLDDISTTYVSRGAEVS
jgi:hypothetical protein